MLVKYFEEDAIVSCTCSTGDVQDTHDHLPMCQSAMLVDVDESKVAAARIQISDESINRKVE